MTSRWIACPLVLSALLAIAAPGCTSEADRGGKMDGSAASKPADQGDKTAARAPDGETAKDEGTGIEPFDPPSFEELNKTAEWIDRPVVDFDKLLRDYLAKEPPLVSVAEALKLRNENKEDNAKILSALGRLPDKDADADWDATINRHSAGEVRNTNPVMFSSTAEADVSGLTGFGFFGSDWNMNESASSDTVVSWQTSKDHLVDKIVMRDDLTWSDGKPITARDVAFSFRLIMNPKVPVVAVRNGPDKLRWVEAYDDHTVVFFHKEALATNEQNINFSVLPEHIYKDSVNDDPTLANSDYHIKLQNSPVVGGSYTITKRVQGQEMVFTRREGYYMHKGKQVRSRPYFKTVRIRFLTDLNTALLALNKGDLDEMVLTPSQWTTQTMGDDFYRRNTKATGVEWVFFYFGWNELRPYFQDVRVRKAMSYAFNYKEMLDTLCYGLYEPCSGIFHPGAWMAPKNPLPFYHQDLSKAEELLDEAGWTDHDGDGVRDKMIDGQSIRFEFTIVCSNVQERVDICTLLAQNLEQIGVVCKVAPTEFAVLQDKTQKKDFDANFGGWGTGTDPDTSDNIWKTGEPRNFVSYSNPEVDKLFIEGRKEFDREKRAAIYAKIDELIYADQPYTFLYYRNSFYGFDKRLRGYKFSPRGPYHYSPGFGSIWTVVP